jgi:hypothetical protein
MCILRIIIVGLGGVMASILDIGLNPGKVRSKPSARLPSEGKYSRRRHVVRFYGMLKITSKYEQPYFVRPNSSFPSHGSSCFATR